MRMMGQKWNGFYDTFAVAAVERIIALGRRVMNDSSSTTTPALTRLSAAAVAGKASSMSATMQLLQYWLVEVVLPLVSPAGRRLCLTAALSDFHLLATATTPSSTILKQIIDVCLQQCDVLTQEATQALISCISSDKKPRDRMPMDASAIEMVEKYISKSHSSPTATIAVAAKTKPVESMKKQVDAATESKRIVNGTSFNLTFPVVKGSLALPTMLDSLPLSHSLRPNLNRGEGSHSSASLSLTTSHTDHRVRVKKWKNLEDDEPLPLRFEETDREAAENHSVDYKKIKLLF